MKQRAILNNGSEVNRVAGIDVNGTTLQRFRKELKQRGFTEVSHIFREGKHVIEFLEDKVSRIQLIVADLIGGTKEEKKLVKEMKKDSLKNLGYKWN